MRITSIEITGWMPFAGNFKLELPVGPIAVVGSHSGDARRSNRAGKTALLEAITWCLYGVHRKRLDDQIINRAVDACEVVVVLDDITVKRTRTRGSSTKLVVTYRDILLGDNVEFVGDAAQNKLTTLIGLGLDDYYATSCFRQGDVEAIVSLSGGPRLVLVSEWLQQSRWTDAKKIQATKASATDTHLAERRAALETAAQYLLSEVDQRLVEIELRQAQAELGTMEVEMQGLSERMMEAVEAKSQLAKHGELKQLRAQAAELRTKLTNRAEADQKTEAAVELEARVSAAARAARAAVVDLVKVRKSGFDGECPVTCEACPVAAEVTKSVRAASTLLATRTAEDGAARATWEAAEAARVAAVRTSHEFERIAAQYQQTVARGKQLSASLTLTEEEAAAAPSAQPLQLQLDEQRRVCAGLSAKAGELGALLAGATKHAERHAALVTEVAAAEEASKVSRLALRAISSVPARIAAQQLGELEQEANVLLEGSGVSLRFSWARELADKAVACEECGYVYPSKRGDACPTCKAARGKKRSQELELLCDDGSGVEEDARYNSGGTRAIVGSSIRLAASAMLRRLRSSRAAWAIVDEPFGSLDAENREQLARTFAGMLSSVGLEQALVVSHDPGLLAALPSRIVVDKDGSSSTARLE